MVVGCLVAHGYKKDTGLDTGCRDARGYEDKGLHVSGLRKETSSARNRLT